MHLSLETASMTNEAMKALVMIVLFGGLRTAILATEIRKARGQKLSSALADWASLIFPVRLVPHRAWRHPPASHAIIERK
jgi:hypothetical protein